MSENIRIIPRLDIKGPNLVKGIHLEGLRVLGKPESAAKYYYDNGADELLFMDVVASLYERNSLHDIIEKTARKMFIPLTVGGGLRTIDDIIKVLRAGADKVSINTAAIKNPEFISEASLKFGSSTIIVAIEAIKKPNGKYYAFTDNARDETGREVLDWVEEIEKRGAGEILITSVDKEGTGEGFDIDLVKAINNKVSIPVIVHGGAGSMQDVVDLMKNCPVEAVALASIFHYEYIYSQMENHKYEDEGNTEFLKNKKPPGRINQCTIMELKKELVSRDFKTRLPELVKI